MKAVEFIEDLRKIVIEDSVLSSKTLLDSSVEAKDPYWKDILLIYNSITEEQKMSFINFLRLIKVNTLSHVLGILDGSSYLNEKREGFKLITEPDQEIINGHLQDIFLEMEEG
jgi:hypothetical protein